MRRRNVAGGQRALEARGAARGQHVVGAGDVVAERGARAAADEHAAGARHPTGQRLGLVADQLEVLGRDLARPARAPRARRSHGDRLRARPRRRSAARGARRSTSADDRLEQLAVRRDQPQRAVLAVLGLGEQVERDQLAGRRRSSATTTSSLGPARPSMPTSPTTWRLASGDVRVARARDHVDRGHASRCRRRARRSPARRPSGRPRSPRRARRRRGSRGGPRRPGPGGAQTAISLAPPPRARSPRTSPRWTGRPLGRPARRRPRGRPAPRRPPPAGPAGSSTATGSRSCASATARTLAMAVRRPSSTSGSSTPTAASSSRASTRSCSGASSALVEALGVARAPPRRRRADRARISRTAPPRRGGRPVAASRRGDPHRPHPLHDRVDLGRLQLVRHRVGDQARGADADLLEHAQAVLGQRAAGGGQVDDAVGQAGQRRQLHRALDLDDLRLAAGVGEVRARRCAGTWSRSGRGPSRRSAEPIGSPPSRVATTMRQRP